MAKINFDTPQLQHSQFNQRHNLRLNDLINLLRLIYRTSNTTRPTQQLTYSDLILTQECTVLI